MLGQRAKTFISIWYTGLNNSGLDLLFDDSQNDSSVSAVFFSNGTVGGMISWLYCCEGCIHILDGRSLMSEPHKGMVGSEPVSLPVSLYDRYGLDTA